MEGEVQGHYEASSEKKPQISGIEDLAYGSLSGMMGKFVEYPFDTVKVRLQTSETQVFSGTLDCLKQTWKHEGFHGFYRGLTSPLIGAMAENAIAFYAYNRIQSAIHAFSPSPKQSPLTLNQLFVCGALSGAICAFVISPVELIKCKLQVENVQGYGSSGISKPKFTGPFSVLTHLLKTQGLRGLYKGILPTVARETVGVGFWFGTYELVCRQLLQVQGKAQSKSELGATSIVLAGGCAGIGYNITSYPIDVVKSFIQTDDVRDAAAKQRPGILSTIKTIYARGGVPAFYRGLGITLLRAFPANAAMFMTYEYLSRLSVALR
ncbi:mitochondrial ornithine carrier protein [Coemansia brasiliensis]|uniref:Mitochondrial ornithine carrier protein n=1 Tax=Coemansia brasiliensis TaxID=2650707 RepID=A0A9W8LZR0_9FUNG|nr:mitochondrial ornithine carrier protein [Coemansia brasiliensis]